MQNEARLSAEPEVRTALDASGRDTIAEVVAEHPGSPLAWTELADVADSEGRPVDAFAYASVAAELAREQLAANGWQHGEPVPWSDEANRSYLRALDTQRRAAGRLGLSARAEAAADELDTADAEAHARIASEFTPTQVIPIISSEALYRAPDDVEAALAEIGEAPLEADAPAAAPFSPEAAPDDAATAAADETPGFDETTEAGPAEALDERAEPDVEDAADPEGSEETEDGGTADGGTAEEASVEPEAETADEPEPADGGEASDEPFDFGPAVTRATFTAPAAEHAADYLAALGLDADAETENADASSESPEATIEADPESAEER